MFDCVEMLNIILGYPACLSVRARDFCCYLFLRKTTRTSTIAFSYSNAKRKSMVEGLMQPPQKTTKALLVAGTMSNAGKTLASLGLMAALTRRGYRTAPFKVGPDFIDPGLHHLATGRVSHNLDGWMLGEARVREIFGRYAAGADVAVVEGVMGLFDGASGRSEDGSSAQVAKWLGAPVVLVVDAKSMARSAAAVVQGYTRFDPALDFAGVLFNRVGSANHRELLREAMGACPETSVLGFLPRDERLELPSRHLGLVTAGDAPLSRERLDRLADWMEGAVDLEALHEALPEVEFSPCEGAEGAAPAARIAVARDRAFCFYYEENLRILRESGAELVFFSPLGESSLPENIQGLYLGGGYPELHAKTLSENAALRREIKAFSEAGGVVYAECGGFMYLMQGLAVDGETLPMCGVFPLTCEMSARRSALGYRTARTLCETPFGDAGTILKGHEFHYSRISSALQDGDSRVYALTDRKGGDAGTEGYVVRNTLGSYVHAHFGANEEAVRHFVKFCRNNGVVHS